MRVRPRLVFYRFSVFDELLYVSFEKSFLFFSRTKREIKRSIQNRCRDDDDEFIGRLWFVKMTTWSFWISIGIRIPHVAAGLAYTADWRWASAKRNVVFERIVFKRDPVCFSRGAREYFRIYEAQSPKRIRTTDGNYFLCKKFRLFDRDHRRLWCAKIILI